MNEKSEILKNFGGLLKKRKHFHFLNSIDLIRHFVDEFYYDKCIVIVLDCKTAFTSIPKLNILKRDDYTSYMLGLTNEFVIIEFNDVSSATDYVYSFPIELHLKYFIYDKGTLIRDEKGLKYGKR